MPFFDNYFCCPGLLLPEPQTQQTRHYHRVEAVSDSGLTRHRLLLLLFSCLRLLSEQPQGIPRGVSYQPLSLCHRCHSLYIIPFGVVEEELRPIGGNFISSSLHLSTVLVLQLSSPAGSLGGFLLGIALVKVGNRIFLFTSAAGHIHPSSHAPNLVAPTPD